MTVSEFINRFIEYVGAHTLRPKTFDLNKYLFDKHFLPELGHLRLNHLRPDHLQTLYSKKLESGLSRRTVQYLHAVIRRALNQAVKWGLIIRIPTDAVEALIPKRQAPVTLTEVQAKRFLEVVKDHRWFPIYVLAAMTGRRRGKVLGLYVEDIDLAQGSVSVKRSIQTLRGQIIIGEP